MSEWAHGYNIEVPYTFGYYRETSPVWVRWICYLHGRKFPEAQRLRILELGCGQGYNLILHAAAHPNWEFWGIDIIPTHIAHGEELARITGLNNVHFLEADFMELKKNWPSELGKFHYVILHGIWSWIDKPVREAVVEILKDVLLPGGIVYLSYNALPGWLYGTFIREVLFLHQKLTRKPALQVVKEGLQILKKLKELKAPIFNFFPNLGERIENLSKHNPHYLVHEYLHESHKIFWVHEVMEEVKSAKLSYLGSSTLSENFVHLLLPEELSKFINSFPDQVFRLFLLDLFLNQAFRKDLYQKGEHRLFPIEQIKNLKNLKFFSVEKPPEQFKFQIGTSLVDGKKEFYEPLMQELSNGPKSLEELLRISPFKESGISALVQGLSMLLSSNLALPYLENQTLKVTKRFNREVVKLAAEGRPYNFVVSPLSGLGVNLSFLEMLILDVTLEGVESLDELTKKTLQRLKQQDKNLLKEGKVIEDPQEEFEQMRNLIKGFLTEKVPTLKALSVI